MWIVAFILGAVFALLIFVFVAILIGTVSWIVIVAALCTAMVLGMIGLLIGVVAMLIGIHHPGDGVAKPREMIRGR